MIIKYKVSLKREYAPIYTQASEKFAIIKNYKLYDPDIGVIMNLPYLWYVTPYFNNTMQWTGLSGSPFRFPDEEDEYRYKRIINHQVHFFSVNSFGDFPFDVVQGSWTEPHQAFHWSSTKLLDTLGEGTLAYSKLKLLYMTLYVEKYYIAREILRNFISAIDPLITSSEKKLQKHTTLHVEEVYRAKRFNSLQRLLYESPPSFLPAVAPGQNVGLQRHLYKADLQFLVDKFLELNLEPQEFDVSWEEYKNFLLFNYGEDSGRFAITNFNESFLEDFKHIEDLLVLEKLFLERIKVPHEIRNTFLVVEGEEEKAKNDFFYSDEDQFFHTYFIRAFLRGLKNGDYIKYFLL